ncbi:hypothetical protein CEXT_352461 [Caerostris extrusa]|uniref:Uncharacterized protein n=1 Tax=Caerostris extrusa TaxID=172846 RepID=A0AAV4XFQ4_CAEEX|nr:hypothetical protein CEXT_352461 [Caerostris extrusa]
MAEEKQMKGTPNINESNSRNTTMKDDTDYFSLSIKAKRGKVKEPGKSFLSTLLNPCTQLTRSNYFEIAPKKKKDNKVIEVHLMMRNKGFLNTFMQMIDEIHLANALLSNSLNNLKFQAVSQPSQMGPRITKSLRSTVVPDTVSTDNLVPGGGGDILKEANPSKRVAGPGASQATCSPMSCGGTIDSLSERQKKKKKK